MLELALGFLANLRFKIRVGGDEQSGMARVDARLFAVEARAENLRGRKMDANLAPADVDIVGLERFEIDAGDDLSVNQHEQAIAGEEVGENGIFLRAGDDLIHGVDDGFEAREALDVVDDCRLRDVDGEAAAGDGGIDAADPVGTGVEAVQRDRRQDQQSCEGQNEDEEND